MELLGDSRFEDERRVVIVGVNMPIRRLDGTKNSVLKHTLHIRW
jgi:hypothetical protein